MELPINQSVITLKGSGCDKGKKNIKNFVKGQPLSDVHRQYLKTFPIDLQAQVSRFRFQSFSLFCLFSQNLARLSSVFIFYKLSLVDCLAFRVI